MQALRRRVAWLASAVALVLLLGAEPAAQESP